MQIKNKRKFFYQLSVCIITFFVYAAFHCSRSTWSYSKTDLQNDPKYLASDDYLGTVDLTFLLCYAASLYAFGWLGDKIDLRIYLGIGLVGTAFMFGTTAMMGFSNYNDLAAFDVMMGLNGMFQSLGWPGCIATMGNWLPQKNRAIIMGLWAGTSNFGNIVGYEIGSITIDQKGLGWKYAVMSSAVFCFVMGVIVLIFLKPYPEEVGCVIREKGDHYTSLLDKRLEVDIEFEDEEEKKLHLEKLERERREREIAINKPIGFMRAWTLPGVPLFVLAYSCTKGTCYGILFWLAPYLKDQGLGDYASSISQVNDIGQFLGGFALGILCDKLGKKAIFLPFYLVLAAVFFALIKFASSSTALYFVFVFFGGFFLGGPYNMIGSAIAADLAKNPVLKGNKKALSTVSGIIEGSGSLTAAIVQKILPLIKDQIFVFFMCFAFVGALIMLPLAYEDFKHLREEKKKEHALLKEAEEGITFDAKKESRTPETEENSKI